MLQTDITILEQRQKVLEKEIDEALSYAPIDDPMIGYLKSRILYVKEEIDRLRHEAFASSTECLISRWMPVPYSTKADKVAFWPETVCLLLTQSGHRQGKLGPAARFRFDPGDSVTHARNPRLFPPGAG